MSIYRNCLYYELIHSNSQKIHFYKKKKKKIFFNKKKKKNFD